MAVLLVVGAVFALVGALLLVNGGGAANFVKRNVTSRYVGSLAPGFANSDAGFAVYARLLSSIGAVFVGVAIAARFAVFGVAVIGVGLVAFAVLSVLAIRGEIATYRGLKR